MDNVQLHQEEVEKRLSCYFTWYFSLIIFMQLLQTFFTMFHKYDSEDSEYTTRYKVGWVFYMIFFFAQVIMLIGTYIFAWTVYLRLIIFLKPKKQVLKADSTANEGFVEHEEEDDNYFSEPMGTQYEMRRQIIAEERRHQYRWLNILFIYILVTLTLRTFTYLGFRLTSKQKIFEWTQIRPVVFYLTYATDFLIVVGVLYFIYRTTESKDAMTQSMTSIATASSIQAEDRENQVTGDRTQPQVSDNESSAEDGDKEILAKRE